MHLIFILLSAVLASHTTSSETCDILNHFIYPNKVLRPDYPKNDVCRYRAEPHCCTRSVETVMQQYADTDAHTLFFSNLMRMRDLTSDQFYRVQSFRLPYMSEAMRLAALDFKLVENLSSSRQELLEQATSHYIAIYYNVEYMPKFCKKDIIRQMKSHISKFLQELIFAHSLVETNWNVANDLFEVIFSSSFSDSCITNLIRSGMTRISCKTCTDSTIKIPTCFDYCVDVVSECLAPYQGINELINEWFNANTKVQARLEDLIHYNRFLSLRATLDTLIQEELKDEFYADVCKLHFQGGIVPLQKPQEYSIVHNKEKIEDGRKKRIAKTKPHTQVYSTRYISFPPTSETPAIKPVVAGNQLFDPDMICFNATKSITNWACWNGEGRGEYNKTSRVHETEEDTTSSATFSIHLPRIKSKINDLKTMIEAEFIVQPTPTINEIGAQTETSDSSRPHFKKTMLLLIVMTWIRLLN